MLDDFQELKRKVERLRRERDIAKGQVKQLLATLKKDFGVSNIKEAKRLLQRLEEKEREKAKRYTAAKRAFEEKWAHLLKGLPSG